MKSNVQCPMSKVRRLVSGCTIVGRTFTQRRLLRVSGGAKRLECVELAPAFPPPPSLRQRQQAGRTPNASRILGSVVPRREVSGLSAEKEAVP